MKPLKITASNEAAIVAALAAVNGKAVSHTFTSISEVVQAAIRAELAGLALVHSKSHLQGCKYLTHSGDTVPNSYKYARQGTQMTLMRRSECWWLINASSVDLYKSPRPNALYLTRAAADKARADLAKAFIEIPDVA